MNFKNWKNMKKVSWALIGFSTIALSIGSTAHADAQSDTQMYCTGCHNGMVVGSNVIGAGEKICGNRGYQGWINTIDRMNVKGCGVSPSATPGMAAYLTCLETGTPNSCSGTATTTTAPVTTTTSTAAITTTVPMTTTTTAPSTTAATTSTTRAMTTTTGVMTTTTQPVVTTTTSTTTTAPTTTSTATVTTTTTTTNMMGCIKGKKNKNKKCKGEHDNDESDHDGERD